MARGVHFRLGLTTHTPSIPYAGAAVSLAIDRARDEGLLTGHTFRYSY